LVRNTVLPKILYIFYREIKESYQSYQNKISQY